MNLLKGYYSGHTKKLQTPFLNNLCIFTYDTLQKLFAIETFTTKTILKIRKLTTTLNMCMC